MKTSFVIPLLNIRNVEPSQTVTDAVVIRAVSAEERERWSNSEVCRFLSASIADALENVQSALSCEISERPGDDRAERDAYTLLALLDYRTPHRLWYPFAERTFTRDGVIVHKSVVTDSRRDPPPVVANYTLRADTGVLQSYWETLTKDDDTSRRLRRALGRWMRARHSVYFEDVIIECWIGLEALFTDHSSRGSVTRDLGKRVTQFISDPDVSPSVEYLRDESARVRQAYGVRSEIAHGEESSAEALVEAGTEAIRFLRLSIGIALEGGLDRLHDLKKLAEAFDDVKPLEGETVDYANAVAPEPNPTFTPASAKDGAELSDASVTGGDPSESLGPRFDTSIGDFDPQAVLDGLTTARSRRGVPATWANIQTEPVQASGISNPAAKIWRYVDLARFWDIIRTRALYFSRIDGFSDPREGSFPKSVVAARRDEFRDFFRDAEERPVDSDVAFSAMFRWSVQWLHVCSWNLREYESASLWERYGSTNGSIVIVSTVGKLRNALPSEISIRELSYIDYAADDFNAGLVDSVALHKGRGFEEERELRAFFYEMRPRGPSGEPHFNRNPATTGTLVPVCLHDLIDEIRINPIAPKWIERLVRDAMRKYGFRGVEIRPSDLAMDPFL